MRRGSCTIWAQLLDKLAELQKELAKWRDSVYAPDRGALDPAACLANERYGGYWRAVARPLSAPHSHAIWH